ncbi:response regulator transcription factor [Herbaspirillum sp. RV1423]|uniref:response regulator transcription factor n=1 Tax=Herbaspirillum sp. RV1423 TaxID=1443993 RepID=UPI0009DCA5DC|nr:response regulator transcription factor [Herbaspirillum sp. RV1423]
MKNIPTTAPASRQKTGATEVHSQAVIICDDHAAIRAGVTRILEERNKRVVGGCGAVPDLLALVKQYPGAVVVMDLGIDQLPFPELMTMLRAASPGCRIVVYSMREAPGTIALCYDAGAIAFVPKSADPEEIVKAVDCARHDERYLPPSVAAALANFHIEDRRSPLATLSAQEKEIFIGYAKGETVDALARRLSVSEKRIQNLLSQIAKKIDAPRSTFFQVARRHGVIDVE